MSYSEIAAYFFNENPNGELLKVILTAIGGLAVFIGLYLNSLRIKQQTEQNNNTKDSNSDKRFSDAVGYLGSKETPIILGGIYALFQLAKEEKRYKAIVANLLCSYLRDNAENLYKEFEIRHNLEKPNSEKKQKIFIGADNNLIPLIVKTIIDILFNNDEGVFENEKFDLSGIELKNVTFYKSINRCDFKNSKISNCTFYASILESDFCHSTIKNCYISNANLVIEDCDFNKCRISYTNFFGSYCRNIQFVIVDFVSVSFNFKSITDSNFINYDKPELYDDFTLSDNFRVLFYNVQDFTNTFIDFTEKYNTNIRFTNSKNLPKEFSTNAPSGDIPDK